MVTVLTTFSQAGGAILFVVAMLGWYITFVIMAAEMRLGINFPVGDLSHFWPSTDVELTEIEAGLSLIFAWLIDVWLLETNGVDACGPISGMYGGCVNDTLKVCYFCS
jgi:hypothetical protein